MLGPGQYDLPLQKSKDAYAPFLSTSKRKASFMDKQVVLPGPG